MNGDTISYFISDGEPTYGMHEDTYWSWDDWAYITGYVRDGNGSSLTDVNDDIVDDWVSLNIDKMYSVGIGDDSLTTYLTEISQSSDDVVIINNANDLDSTLQNTVNTITGDILDNIQGGDGEITIDNIVVDDVTYTKDDFPQDGISLDGDGTFKFNFDDGTYSYSAKSSEFDEMQ